jgi:hypothetical protein
MVETQLLSSLLVFFLFLFLLLVVQFVILRKKLEIPMKAVKLMTESFSKVKLHQFTQTKKHKRMPCFMLMYEN